MCYAIAAILAACMGGVPDMSKTVVIPRRCVARLSLPMKQAGPDCAKERGISWRIGRRGRA